MVEIASDEDGTVGYVLDGPDVPRDPDALLGVFIVRAREEWDTLYDPARLTLSHRPARYRWSETHEQCVPAGKRKADSRWWVITGLHEAEYGG